MSFLMVHLDIKLQWVDYVCGKGTPAVLWKRSLKEELSVVFKFTYHVSGLIRDKSIFGFA